MFRVLVVSIVLACCVSVSGCFSGILKEPSEKVAQNVAKGLVFYCQNTAEEFRKPFRERVNALADPYTIAADCDPTDNTGPASFRPAEPQPATPLR